ncbi:MAG: hypothetical protein JXA57_10055 [Armatimonadetes bacterium]|nr:hypothetical protein [Armatimonadota bacterium]
MRAGLLAVCVLALFALNLAALAESANDPPPVSAPRVTLTNTGMEALSEVRVQVHLVGSPEWRELVDLDEANLAARITARLQGTRGVRLVQDNSDPQIPRLLIVVVGHLIADPEGNTDTAATNLEISLNQPVSLRRALPSGRAVIVPGMTWHRSVLVSGLASSMRDRVDQKLTYLVGQFRSEHARANPGLTAGANG